MQHPGMIRPEIGKLPKTIVDRIPLVIYIPPPDGLAKEMPSFPHIYPPKPTRRRLRFKLLQSFAFFGSRSSKPETPHKPSEDEGENKADSWADNWEQGQYPFVTLEGNRAACAICLSDFEAPPKRNASNNNEEEETSKDQDHEKVSVPEASTSDSAVVAQDSNTGNERQKTPLKLEDAGSGPQPLRLLGCAHAFHVRAFPFTSREFLTHRLLSLANMHRSLADRRLWTVPRLSKTSRTIETTQVPATLILNAVYECEIRILLNSYTHPCTIRRKCSNKIHHFPWKCYSKMTTKVGTLSAWKLNLISRSRSPMAMVR